MIFTAHQCLLEYFSRPGHAVSATGMPFLALFPTGDRTMRLDCHWFSPDWGNAERPPLWARRMDNFVRILEEDLRLVPQIQNSMESAGFKGVQVGYQERRIYHWHEALDRRVERVPKHLRWSHCWAR
jgi:hypothetical protein